MTRPSDISSGFLIQPWLGGSDSEHQGQWLQARVILRAAHVGGPQGLAAQTFRGQSWGKIGVSRPLCKHYRVSVSMQTCLWCEHWGRGGVEQGVDVKVTQGTFFIHLEIKVQVEEGPT